MLIKNVFESNRINNSKDYLNFMQSPETVSFNGRKVESSKGLAIHNEHIIKKCAVKGIVGMLKPFQKSPHLGSKCFGYSVECLIKIKEESVFRFFGL